MSTRWEARPGDPDYRAHRDCPVCGWGPFDNEELSCPNKACRLHWQQPATMDERRAVMEEAR